MKVVDREVFIVGYRKSDNDDWLVSGTTFGNRVDAEASARLQKSRIPDVELKVFKYGRAIPVEV